MCCAPRLGGHSNAVDAVVDGRPVPVDTGFIVYNEPGYPSLVQLFPRSTSRPRRATCRSRSRWGTAPSSGTDLAGMVAQKRNLLRPRFWRMVADILRFYRETRRALHHGALDPALTSASSWRGRYSAAFLDDHLLPMGAAILVGAVQREMLGFDADFALLRESRPAAARRATELAHDVGGVALRRASRTAGPHAIRHAAVTGVRQTAAGVAVAMPEGRTSCSTMSVYGA